MIRTPLDRLLTILNNNARIAFCGLPFAIWLSSASVLPRLRCLPRARSRCSRHSGSPHDPSRSLTDARRTRYLLDLVADLGRAYLEGRLDRRMRVYLAPKVLIIDEMGYLPLDELGATSFFQLEHFAAIDLEVQ